jgi:hypothetical protein
MQAITLWLVCTVAFLSLVTVAMGLFSTLTGRDALPQSVRRRMRRTPASAEDFRLHGVGLMLNGAALALIASYVVINVVVGLTTVSFGPAYSLPDSSVDFPRATTFFVSAVAAIVAVALFVAARAITARVHYQSAKPAPGVPPG